MHSRGPHTHIAEKNGEPFSLYVLKIASRCNLNCRYCYMYNLGDSSYMQQPKVMSQQVVSALCHRIKKHCVSHGLERVTLVLHGGEPLLAGEQFVRNLVLEVRSYFSPDVEPQFCMQTNGTLLSSRWIDVLVDLQIGFGISLDGPPDANDANRVDHLGRGSYASVREAIRRALADNRCSRLFGSVLTVVNLAVDPLVLYRHFRDMGLRGVDFLLPDGTYDCPPPGLSANGAGTPYADWLIPIFDEWFREGDPSFSIRFFENIMALVFGSQHSTDNIGGRPNNILVIETDGGLEPVDVLKVCGNNFTKLGLNVLRNEIDDAYQSDLLKLYKQGGGGMCRTCELCPISTVCGGGYLPHRYRTENGFDNPSVYCRDLMKLIIHIQERTIGSLTVGLRRDLALAPLRYEDALKSVETSRQLPGGEQHARSELDAAS